MALLDRLGLHVVGSRGDLAVHDADAQCGACLDVTDGGDDLTPGTLHDGVPTLEGGQRRERSGPSLLVGDVVVRPSQDMVEGTSSTLAQVVDLDDASLEQAARVGEGGTCAQIGQ